ncbi:MAG TPA: DUF3592 domain-containing protein [Terriglobales bacterium]|nr:DUF3592 domain-containing protein [Terriglobales bacterium]
MRNRFVWLCVPFVLAGGTCLAVSVSLFGLEWQYHSSARKTDGTVLNKWRSASGPSGSVGGTTSRGSGPSGSGVAYTIRYQYHTASGSIWQDEDDVGPSYWNRLQPGDSLNVYYLPKRPGHSRVWLGMRWLWPLILLLVGGPMTFMGVVFEFLIVADLRRKHGKHAPSLRPMPTG